MIMTGLGIHSTCRLRGMSHVTIVMLDVPPNEDAMRCSHGHSHNQVIVVSHKSIVIIAMNQCTKFVLGDLGSHVSHMGASEANAHDTTEVAHCYIHHDS